MKDLVPSLIRTWTPMIVGAILAWLTGLGVELDSEAAAGLGVFLTALFSGLYYLVIRLLERERPELGVLLGSAQMPRYSAPVKSKVKKGKKK